MADMPIGMTATSHRKNAFAAARGRPMQANDATYDLVDGPGAFARRLRCESRGSEARNGPGFLLSRYRQKQRNDVRPSQPHLRQALARLPRKRLDRMPRQ